MPTVKSTVLAAVTVTVATFYSELPARHRCTCYVVGAIARREWLCLCWECRTSIAVRLRFACVQQQAGPKFCNFRLKVRCAELQLRLGARCGVLQQGLASLFILSSRSGRPRGNLGPTSGHLLRFVARAKSTFWGGYLDEASGMINHVYFVEAGHVRLPHEI